MEGDGDIEDITQQMFQIKLIPDNKPEAVMVCTYIYLPQGIMDMMMTGLFL